MNKDIKKSAISSEYQNDIDVLKKHLKNKEAVLALDKHMKSPIDHYYHAWRDAKITHRYMGLLTRQPMRLSISA